MSKPKEVKSVQLLYLNMHIRAKIYNVDSFRSFMRRVSIHIMR